MHHFHGLDAYWTWAKGTAAKQWNLSVIYVTFHLAVAAMA